ncbi:VOC family protein, partial [Mesorhizobium sp. M2D.F.Ca.ET.145.01.1.1]
GAGALPGIGAGRRDPSRSGLAWVEMRSDNVASETTREDPWGTVIRTVPGKA